MNTRKYQQLGFFLLLLSILVAGQASAEVSYNGLVVFGDSLSDPGNKYVVTGLSNTPPYNLLDEFLIPDGPYTRGGLHHSNGKTWVEQYAKPLGMGKLVRPALRNPGVATNYAYGGARARDASVTSPNMHLPEQVSTYLANLADYGGIAPSDALYVIFIGGNDIAPDAVTAFATPDLGPAVGVGIIIDAFVSVGDRVVELYTAGARKFLIMNAPDMGLIPAMNPPLNVPQASGLGTCLSVLYNNGSPLPFPYDQFCPPFPPGIPGLNTVLDQLEANLPGIEIIRFDIFEKLQQIVVFPEGFGLLNGSGHCVMPEVPPFACKSPDDYVFWDGTHPTKAAHGVIANEVAAKLAE
jgi:phospholipase/lecithinase/hemolysin